MTKELAVFNNGDFTARTFTDEDGVIWVVAKDVAQSLGYEENSLNQMNNLLAPVPEIWKGHKRIMVRSENGVEQKREMLCLTEQGLYFFLGRSDKKAALPYQIWVAGEVVPSIRKTGKYSVKKTNAPVVIEEQEEEFEPKLKYLSRGMFRTAAQIFEGVFAMHSKEFSLEDCAEAQKILALDKIFEAATGQSALKLAGIKIKVDCDDWYDKKRQGTHYLRKFRWVYKDIPLFREYDFVPDDDSEFLALMKERAKYDYEDFLI